MLQTRDDFSAFRKGYILKNREIQSVVTVLMVCCWVVMDFYLCIYLFIGGQQINVYDCGLAAEHLYWFQWKGGNK